MSLLLVFNEHSRALSCTGGSSYLGRKWTERVLGEERKYMRKYGGKESSGDGEETGTVVREDKEGPILCKVDLSNIF